MIHRKANAEGRKERKEEDREEALAAAKASLSKLWLAPKLNGFSYGISFLAYAKNELGELLHL